MEADDFDEAVDVETARVLAIDAHDDLLNQIEHSGAITAIVRRARETAIQAMRAIVKVDPHKVELVRRLQWEIRRYEDLCGWIAEIMEVGTAAREDLTAEQAAELERLMRGDEATAKDA